MVKKCSSILLLFALGIVFVHNYIPHYHADHSHDLSLHHSHHHDYSHFNLFDFFLHTAHPETALAFNHIHSVSNILSRHFISLIAIPSDYDFNSNQKIGLRLIPFEFLELTLKNESLTSSGLRGPPFTIA